MEFFVFLVEWVNVGDELLFGQALCEIDKHFEAVVWSDRIEPDCDYAYHSILIVIVIEVQEGTENGSPEGVQYKHHRLIPSILQPLMQTLSLLLHRCILYPRLGLLSSKCGLQSLGVNHYGFAWYSDSFELIGQRRRPSDANIQEVLSIRLLLCYLGCVLCDPLQVELSEAPRQFIREYLLVVSARVFTIRSEPFGWLHRIIS